jgi:2-oxoglutarate dehydrogenase E2 component (dihydrolipoamide succinyltransferase)
MTQIIVPGLGESVTEATVAKWLKQEGESVAVDEPVVELETDKVTMEVNAPADGVISKIIVAEGEDVEVGAVLAELGKGVAANDANKESVPEPEAVIAPEPVKEEAKAGPKLSPAVRKLLADNDLDASLVAGTGKNGNITKGDVLKYLEGQDEPAEKAPIVRAPAPKPAVPAAPAAPRKDDVREERVRMSRLRQSVAAHLKDAQNTAAILTTFNEVDMSEVIELRKEHKDSFEKKHGVKLGFMSFFVKATVGALKDIPAINAEIDGEDIIYKNYYDIGVAVSTDQGLVVPVVRDCDSKSMAQIERDIADMGTRAREGKISIDDMTGGTFTITNGGIFGSMMSTPIINAPQSGILGMHNIKQRPMVMEDGSIEARPMMYLALSYDHRIIDGKEAVTFLVKIKEAIEDPQRLLLDI